MNGVAIEIRVRDLDASCTWYERFFGRPPDLTRSGRALWQLVTGCWFEVAAGEPRTGGYPIRFGVGDVVAERQRLAAELGVEATPVQSLAGAVSWCDFADPDGNPLGLYEDLEPVVDLADDVIEPL